MSQSKLVTIGSDPEVIIIDEQGHPKSMIGYVGGDKKNPKYINGIGFQEDNVLVEFNTVPCSNGQELFEQIQNSLELIKENFLPHNWRISEECGGEYSYDELFLHPEQALEFGCDPDFCVYENAVRNQLDPEDFQNLRFAGGHIHIGYTQGNEGKNGIIAMLLDALLILPTVNRLSDWEKQRRTLGYGVAGSIRHKPYGLEYRTPSNDWIFNENKTEIVYETVKLAVELSNHDDVVKQLHKMAQNIREAINKSDMSGVKDMSFVEKYSLVNV